MYTTTIYKDLDACLRFPSPDIPEIGVALDLFFDTILRVDATEQVMDRLLVLEECRRHEAERVAEDEEGETAVLLERAEQLLDNNTGVFEILQNADRGESIERSERQNVMGTFDEHHIRVLASCSL